jgi:hypothetical protein
MLASSAKIHRSHRWSNFSKIDLAGSSQLYYLLLLLFGYCGTSPFNNLGTSLWILGVIKVEI